MEILAVLIILYQIMVTASNKNTFWTKRSFEKEAKLISKHIQNSKIFYFNRNEIRKEETELKKKRFMKHQSQSKKIQFDLLKKMILLK